MFEVIVSDVRPFILASSVPVTDELITLAVGKLERLLVSKVPNIIERTAGDPALLALARDQIIESIARWASNPLGIRQEMEGGYSITLDRAIASGLLGFTPEQLALLAPQVDVQYGRPIRSQIPCYRVI